MKAITVNSPDLYSSFSTVQQNMRSMNMLHGGSSQSSSAEGSQRWLKATDAFANRIQNVWQTIYDESNNAAAASLGGPVAGVLAAAVQRLPRDIVVAVIDDGVDTEFEDLSECIKPGKTLNVDSDGRVRPWYISEGGHGTAMAQLIHRVCPMAKILPIRLKTFPGRKIDEESAIEAINAAIDCEADIISMSWTVSKPSAGPILDQFQAAIGRAIKENVLMFCSSPDGGWVGDSCYPAGYRPDEVIKVGAADGAAMQYNMAGNINNLDFLFPGVEVQTMAPSNGPPGTGEKNRPALTGSSVATALGAGLASLIMFCAQIGYLHKSFEVDGIQLLRERQVMFEAIHSFSYSVNSGTNNKFVEVWKKLDEKTMELAICSPEVAREKVASLVRSLVSKLA